MLPPRVPVIEDDHDAGPLLERYFRKRERPVAVAYPQEARFGPAPADPPDAAVVDVVLSGLDGREVVRGWPSDGRTRNCRPAVFWVLDRSDLTGLAYEVPAKPFRQPVVARLVDSCRSSVAQESQEE